MKKTNTYYKNPFYGDADFKQLYEQALDYFKTEKFTFADFIDFINIIGEW